jgi:ABC-type transporter MlaC component
MTGSTQFPSRLSGMALIAEARAARQEQQDDLVKAHVRAILSRLKFHQTPPSQDPRQDHRKAKAANVR